MTSSFSRYFENLSLCLNSLTIVCLGWFCLSLPCLEYIKIVGYVDFIIFSEFGEFYIIISSNIVSAPFFFTWDTHNIPITFMWWHSWQYPTDSNGSVHFFFPVCSPDSIISSDLSSSVLAFLPAQICFWTPLVTFHFNYCIF